MKIKNLSEYYRSGITSYFEMTNNKSKSIKVSVLALILVGLLDYITGPQFGFFVFYYIPILYAGWFIDKKTVIIYAFAATVIWWIADSLGENIYGSEFFRYWNSFIRLISFLLVGIVFSNSRQQIVIEKQLSGKLSKTLSEIKQLRGLLPICASCKNVRDDKGYWEQIEVYVKDHSDANFSHSICPSCMEKLYPGVLQKRKDKLAAAEKNETEK